MRLDTRPQGQISPAQYVEIRTDTLRHALADLRAHAREISNSSTWADYEIELAGGRVLHTGRRGTGTGDGAALMGTLEANLLDESWEPIKSYRLL